MSEGPKRTTVGRTIGRTMRNGESLTVDMPTPGKVRFTVRDHRCRVYVDMPADAQLSDGEDKNLDDLEDR